MNAKKNRVAIPSRPPGCGAPAKYVSWADEPKLYPRDLAEDYKCSGVLCQCRHFSFCSQECAAQASIRVTFPDQMSDKRSLKQLHVFQ
jgi:hypothetical protein